jgi:hypothetical protein
MVCSIGPYPVTDQPFINIYKTNSFKYEWKRDKSN